METKTIRTNAGNLELIPATIGELRGIASYWPMGLGSIADSPTRFGLVFQRGEQEVYGIKMQPPDILEAHARAILRVNRASIAAALPSYLERQHRGVMLPCTYYKERAAGMAESGIAFFVGPDAASKAGLPKGGEAPYDARFGDGATSMVVDMLDAIARARKECGLPQIRLVSVESRPRRAIGGLAMQFVVEGPRVFVIGHSLQEDEPVWEYMVRAGFSRLPYAPMEPVALPANASGE